MGINQWKRRQSTFVQTNVDRAKDRIGCADITPQKILAGDGTAFGTANVF
jgi:hypothetical protein